MIFSKKYFTGKQLLFLAALAFMLVLNSSCKNQDHTNKGKVESVVSTLNRSDIVRVEPLNWWVGFKNNDLQLLVKHPNVSNATPALSYQGVTIKKVHKADSPNYLFINLSISKTAKAGKFDIIFKQEHKDDLIYTYELKSRQKPAKNYIGFDSSDVIYLITPDRFANGDTKNDINKTLSESTIDRTDNYARHGGDIRGVINHLDYIESMGFTTIWPNPLLINNMDQGSYHGYAITDFYNVDPRFGTLKDYRELADKTREKGMKLIMDQVANHCGSKHWWMQDLPFKDWVNFHTSSENKESIIYTNHRRTTNQDVYASKADKDIMVNGWFVPTMPDLNQRNPFMAKYIIQNSIWWIETIGLSGIRQDTYPYPDKEFMSQWANTIMTEYPNFSIVGEEWSYNPLLVGYWQNGANNKDGYNSNLKSTMDFPMQKKIIEALNEEESWDKGLIKLYEGLANDFYYPTPKDIVAFVDNHDKSRVFTELKGDLINTKIALSYLLTLPRIPQIYYGTEILMDDFDKPGDHGLIRADFPGGWRNDTVNAFSGHGLSKTQKEMQLFLKKVLNYRKHSDAIHKGKTIHFVPQDGVYVLFRIYDKETVVHIINKNEKPVTLDLTRFSEIDLEEKSLMNIISGGTVTWNTSLLLDKKGSTILTTKL